MRLLELARPFAFPAAMAAIVAVALAFRLFSLADRPMHTDEAVQAERSRILLQEGRYRYDPAEFHGPVLQYVSLPFMWLSAGRDFSKTSEVTFRVIPALFGAGIVLLTLLLKDGLGRAGVLVAMLLAAISPAMVFYSRYYIHETPLVFLTFGVIACGWRYVVACRPEAKGRLRWAILTGAFLGLAHATKETCAVAFFSMAVGLLLVYAWRRWVEGVKPGLRPYLDAKALAWAAGVAFAVSFVLHSSFFTNMRGPLDSVLTQFIGVRRGVEGGIHDHPWHYYIGMLLYTKMGPGPWWSEGPILFLAVAGGIAAVISPRRHGDTFFKIAHSNGALFSAGPLEAGCLKGVPPCLRGGRGGRSAGPSIPLVRFLVFYTLTMVVVYSLVPYKTPWCALSFLHGMILLAGVGAVAVVRRVPGLPARAAATAVLAVAGLHLARQSHRASFRFCADRRNPYAYSPTTRDAVRMAKRVEEVAAVAPEGRDMLVKVCASGDEQWPLPWYFRRLRRVGYWAEPPADCDAPVVIASLDLQKRLEAKLKDSYQTNLYGLRPTVHLLLYVRRDLWDLFMSRRAGADPGPALDAGGALDIEPLRRARGRLLRRFPHDAMGSTFAVMILGEEAAFAAGAAQAAFEDLDRIESELSRYVESSDVARISRLRAGESVRVGVDTFGCLAFARRVSAETGGAFDVTVGALLSAWRAPDGSPRVPSDEELARARARTGMHLLAIDEGDHSVGVKTDALSVDLGGIGKGWALDRMAERLRELGVASAVIHGGESSCIAIGAPAGAGGSEGRDAWRIGLRDPRDDSRTIGSAVLGPGRGVSGSGLLLRGRHIVDPRTGRPVSSEGRVGGMHGTWAAAPSAALADALSTAFMVMSAREVAAYCRDHPEVSAALVPAGERGAAPVLFGARGEFLLDDVPCADGDRQAGPDR